MPDRQHPANSGQSADRHEEIKKEGPTETLRCESDALGGTATVRACKNKRISARREGLERIGLHHQGQLPSRARCTPASSQIDA